MKKIEKKIITSLIILVISIIIGFSLLSIVYQGNFIYEIIVALVVIFVIIVLLVIIKNFYDNFSENN